MDATYERRILRTITYYPTHAAELARQAGEAGYERVIAPARGRLLFSFDPGQVGPYALGYSQVLIPYPALESVSKPEVPIWQY